MKTSDPVKKSSLSFFILVFALSIPFWLLGVIFNQGLPLPINLPVSALMVFCPLIAALILVYKEEKLDGIRRLLRRIFDYRRIKKKIWLVPAVFLMPAIYLLSYAIMRLIGRPLPEPYISFLTIPILFVGFFVLALGEEVGWMGYAVDPMQNRWNALVASIILGAVWGLWHIIPDIQTHHSLTWIVWQRGIYSTALRILIIWLYNNTGKSVFAAILFHDMDNVSWALFPNNGSHYDPAITGAITFIIAAIVTFLWGSKTLSQYRYA